MRLLTILFLFGILCPLEAQPVKKKREFGKFPKERCYLRDLRKRAKALQRNECENARRLIEEIDRQVLEDPKIRRLTTKTTKMNTFVAGKYHPPFDKNRTGKKIKGLYINASDVKTNRQQFILAACPREKEDAGDYIHAALQQKTKVFVSLLKSTEAKTRYNNFWTKNLPKLHRLRDGYRVTHVSSRVLQKLYNSPKATTPQIIETTLEKNKKQFTHLHYEGWRDKRGVPCEELLETLLDRIYELSPDPEVPVAINCRGGTGRTGMVALCLHLRREVDAQLAKGVLLDKVRVNIPEAIYSFRHQRKSIVGIPAQFAQIYTVLADYYERLQQQENSEETESSASLTPPSDPLLN